MMRFEELDLAQIARETLDCVTGDHTTADILTVRDAADVAITQVAARVRRPLDAHEQTLVAVAMFAEWQQRRERMRANLRETQIRLHRPLRGVA